MINKTNQFNLNGIRISEEELREMITSEYKLLVGELIDINGSHGEIISVLISNKGEIISFVMSCRVFQRKILHD